MTLESPTGPSDASAAGNNVAFGELPTAPEPLASELNMTDTRSLLIRPISPEDRHELLEGFERLSERSRYRRFLAPRGELTEAELRYFTEVDHHDHEALVALDPATGEGVGVARYVRHHGDPVLAELAVAVADDWQRRGVGGRLVTALAGRAREEGITTFSALLLADNELMLGLLEDLGRPRVVRRERGTLEVTVDLPVTGIARLKRMLRAVARGELRALAPWATDGTLRDR
jgi:GNAT superfamily N-acetyltransferase